jgi:hypothetical protein
MKRLAKVLKEKQYEELSIEKISQAGFLQQLS